MSGHTFTGWLKAEAFSTRCALLKAYEKRGMLLYIEGPSLEKEYMEKIGNFEENVIKEEIEAELLQKKKQMIQIAINRHEIIDEAAIDAEIDKMRSETLKEAEGKAPTEFADISEEQQNELSELYREIVKKYQPSVNKDITEIQKLLFEKANDAFRKRDLEAMRLIYDMLKSTEEDNIPLELSAELDVDVSFSSQSETNATDYTLVSQIYGSFEPTGDEVILMENNKSYKRQVEDVFAEIEKKRTEFPYNTAEMLSDAQKLQEYKGQLEYRLNKAKESRKLLEAEIKTMIESVKTNG